MKRIRHLIIIFSMINFVIFAVGCEGNASIPEPAERMSYTSEINDALIEATTPILPREESETIQYHVIIDSRICNSATGFFGKNCTSFKKALSLVNDALYNKDAIGYYTTTEYQVRDESKKVIGTAVYKECDNVFQKASMNKLSDTSAYPAEVIQDVASKTREGNVCIFVTDLAMPKEGDQYLISDALEAVISQPNLTIGLIGFKADYSAKTIQDLPRTVTHRGLDLPTRIFQKNAYILVMGEKKAVFNLVDNFMKSCEGDSIFSEKGKVECIYYFKYSCDSTIDASSLKAGKQFVSIEYSEAIQNNMTETNKYSYDYKYVFSDVPEDEEIVLRLQKMPLSKIYYGVKKLSEKDTEVVFNFDYPFEVTTGVGKPASKKLGDASAPLELSQMEFSTNSEISIYNPSSSWTNAETKGLYIEKDAVNISGGNISLVGSLDFSKIEQDKPAIFRARLAVNINDVPEEAIKRGYDVSWLADWQMDQTVIKKYWMKDAAFDESMKTPYVDEIFGQSLVSYATSENRNRLLKSSNEYVQTSVFGIALREQVLSYNREKDWEDDEDFGWAFSRNDVLTISSNK